MLAACCLSSFLVQNKFKACEKVASDLAILPEFSSNYSTTNHCLSWFSRKMAGKLMTNEIKKKNPTSNHKMHILLPILSYFVAKLKRWLPDCRHIIYSFLMVIIMRQIGMKCIHSVNLLLNMKMGDWNRTTHKIHPQFNSNPCQQ